MTEVNRCNGGSVRQFLDPATFFQSVYCVVEHAGRSNCSTWTEAIECRCMVEEIERPPLNIDWTKPIVVDTFSFEMQISER